MFKITGGKGFHITFLNGWTVSVQFGPGNYCDNYDMPFFWYLLKDTPEAKLRNLKSHTAEIAAWNDKGHWYQFDDGDTVKGYVSSNELLAFMNKIASIKDEDEVPMAEVVPTRKIFRGENNDTPST